MSVSPVAAEAEASVRTPLGVGLQRPPAPLLSQGRGGGHGQQQAQQLGTGGTLDKCANIRYFYPWKNPFRICDKSIARYFVYFSMFNVLSYHKTSHGWD